MGPSRGVSHAVSQRRRFRVRAAFFAAAERDRAERCLATRFACLDTARFDADRRLSRLSARFVARGVCEKAFCGARRDPSRDRVWLDVLFVSYRVLEEATLLQLAAPSRGQWRWPALVSGHRVRPRECVPFPRAQTHLPACWGLCPHARLRALVRLLLLLAYQPFFASSHTFGRGKLRRTSARPFTGRTRFMIERDEPGSLGLVLTLEGLIMGIAGKKLLWRALAAAKLPQLNGYDFEEIQCQAEQQIDRIEAERMRAVHKLFTGTDRSQ